MKVAAVVNFCSNDRKFLDPCLKELKKAVSSVVVPVCTHFFDGTPEDLFYLKTLFAGFPNVLFVFFPFERSLLPKKGKKIEKHLWASIARFIGHAFLPKKSTHTLFLDVDEVPDGKRLKAFFNKECPYDLAQLSCYWYFRDPTNQAVVLENTPLLVKNLSLTKKLLLDKDERSAIYEKGKGKKHPHLYGLDQLPLIHHYSWVRTKEEMQKKVRSWGHAEDRDWEALVEKEFKRSFQGKDFVHGYSFQKVEPFIELKEPKCEKSPGENWQALTEKELYSLLYRPKIFQKKSLKGKLLASKIFFADKKVS